MKRKLLLSILIVFFTTSFMFVIGCSDNRKVDYQLQEQCGKRSDDYCKNCNSDSESYKNHYNKKLNKCFILVMKGENGKLLMDVNERKQYGFFFSNKDDFFCDVLDKSCKSIEEWDKLVKPYMED